MLLKIEYAIANQKMSKREFYEKSGVSSSLYSQWNTGSVKPTMKSLGRVAAALGTSVEFLIGAPEKEKEPADDADELAEAMQLLRDRPDLRAMLHAGARTKPETVKKVTELFELMEEG